MQNVQPSKTRFTAIPAVYLILKKGDKYLFGKRQNTGYMDGYYSLPAGHIDGGESLKTALVREAKEEINLEIKEKDLELVFVTHKFDKDDTKIAERLDFFFECSSWDDTQIQNMEEDKCTELAWLELSNPEIIPYLHEVLSQIEKGHNYMDTHL